MKRNFCHWSRRNSFKYESEYPWYSSQICKNISTILQVESLSYSWRQYRHDTLVCEQMNFPSRHSIILIALLWQIIYLHMWRPENIMFVLITWYGDEPLLAPVSNAKWVNHKWAPRHLYLLIDNILQLIDMIRLSVDACRLPFVLHPMFFPMNSSMSLCP